MKGHIVTIVVLLLAVASYVAELNGLGLALFFVGAALEIALWLRAVQAPRRVSERLLARIDPNR